jgi:hypothetical protein
MKTLTEEHFEAAELRGIRAGLDDEAIDRLALRAIRAAEQARVAASPEVNT